MGHQMLIVVLGMLLIVGIFVSSLSVIGNSFTDNASASYAQNMSKEINNAAIELALRTLADSSKWRSTLSNNFGGGSATVTFKDTVVGTDSAIVLRSHSKFNAGTDSADGSAQVIVKPGDNGFIPHVVRAAFTAFGPINDAISDMVIDGRNWDSLNTKIYPVQGAYAVSTGASSFVDNQMGALGGTIYTSLPGTDIAPAYPYDPRVVETSSYWSNGWPTTADAALGLPDGTLKDIAIKKLIPGSQYVTSYTNLKFPLKGVTYIEVPNGTIWSKKNIGASPSGLLVFHSPATNAYWDNITVSNSVAFKGLMIFDNVFHIHMDILGGIVILTPNTVQGKTCNGNNGHFIRYSSEAIMGATAGSGGASDASWKARLKVLSWYE